MTEQVEKILSLVYTSKYEIAKKLKHHIRTDAPRMSIAKLLLTHTEQETIQIFTEYIKKRRRLGTLAFYIEKFGPIEGEIRYKEKNANLSVGVNSLRKRGYTEKEIYQIKCKHAKGSTNSLENMKLRHGDELGVKKYLNYESTFRTRSSWCVEYWLSKGVSLEAAIEKVSEVQKRDLSFFINIGWSESEYLELCRNKTYAMSLAGYKEKYGDRDGVSRKRFDCAKSSNIEYYREKYGSVLGEEKYNSMLRRKAISSRNSKLQLEFASLLFSSLPPTIQEVFYGEPYTDGFWINFGDNEFGIRCCVPDIKIKNIIIEFDGTYWHSLPQQKHRDAQKDMLLEQTNHIVHRISEDEYTLSPNEVVEKVVEFIIEHIDFNFKYVKDDYEN